MPTSDHPAVDTLGEPYVSFLPGPSPARGARFTESPVPVSVDRGGTPNRPSETAARGGSVDGYPIQRSKVQSPPLRDDTLARSRLLDWLAAKVHNRVVFVVAEAGYGKTTLLADFSRRTRLRTLWYRLDTHDRDWIAFLSHLVAAGREYDPSFGQATDSLLRRVAANPPTREAATAAFIRDAQSLGTEGAVVIFDDYHTVDDSPDVRAIVGELLAHAPDRVSLVFASRRVPSVRVAKLRALGEVAELSTDDLRFSEPETEQLFRESYGRPLEHDVLGDLSTRTEGWAASLQLVQAAIRERSPGEIRTFIRSLTGAEGDLYDYLAEEVIGDLSDDLQTFLMKVSVLESIDPNLAAAAADVDATAAGDFLAAAEKIGVLGRRGRTPETWRGFHPLVRDFLRARLARETGEETVVATHVRIARAAEGADWKVACFHYAAADRPDDVRRVIQSSMREIMGLSQFRLATTYLDRYGARDSAPELEAVRGRAEVTAGRWAEGLARVERAAAMAPDSDIVLTNLMSVTAAVGDIARVEELAAAVGRRSADPEFLWIAGTTSKLIELSTGGNISTFVRDVVQMANQQHQLGQHHYAGISFLNAANALRAQGAAERSLELATLAVDLLQINSRADEVGAARQIVIWALGHLARWTEARSEIRRLFDDADRVSRPEAETEVGSTFLWYGDEGEARSLLDAAGGEIETRPDLVKTWRLAVLEQAVRDGKFDVADEIAQAFPSTQLTTEPAFLAHYLTIDAYRAFAKGERDAPRAIDRARRVAGDQEAHFWSRYAAVLDAATMPVDGFALAMLRATEEAPAHLSILAEVMASRLADANESLLSVVASESNLRPERWRSALRAVAAGNSASKWDAARVLDEIGDREDIARLRALSKSAKGRQLDRALGRRLARRLAPRVFVEDQGRVAVRVGDRTVQASEIRRKVLALLCFLISRHDLSATRDQVLDALWPDLEPNVALNSLNQTVYFLRRVFEPKFSEQLSPGYVQHDGNVLWLDRELVSARTAECWNLVREATASGAPSAVDALASTYRAKFALDFAYEEWAIAYRDSLHAAYLHAIETAVSRDTAEGAYDRAIGLARRALAADPEADQMEIALLRLYRLSGAHSAAAEQYSHYAAVMRREIGVEPPPIEMV